MYAAPFQKQMRLYPAVSSGNAGLVDNVADEWRSLCHEGSHDEPFFRPEWISAYLQSFEPHTKVKLFTARDEYGIRAVLPLVEHSSLFCGIPARRLLSPSNMYSCRFDLVHGPEDPAQAIACIWQQLKQERWDVLEFRFVQSIACRDGFPTGQRPTFETPYLPMEFVNDPVNACPNAHFRQNLRRRKRNAANRWSVRLERSTHATPEALNEFYRLESSGWKGRKGTAISNSPSAQAFYSRIASAAEHFGYLALYTLRFDQDPVAAHLGLFYNGRYHIPKVAYDERYATFSPGHLIIEAALSDCIPRGIREFDFFGSAMAWKLEWTSKTRLHNNCYIFRNNARGRALYRAKLRVAAWFESFYKHSLREPLRQIFSRRSK
jgi:CelD/BcsL family acetyltransferase involved in cellulose biosynthesis